MSKSDADKKVDAVKAGKACDHIGFYVGYGYEVFPIATGDFIAVSGVICMVCGMQWHQTQMIEGPVKAKSSLIKS